MLRWLIESTVVDENVLVPGKELRLEAHPKGDPPVSFEIHQVHSTLARQVLRLLMLPEQRLVSTFLAIPAPHDFYYSDRLWKLPAPRGFRKSAAFAFTTDNGERSPRLYSSRLGAAKVNVRVGGAVPIGVGGTAAIDTTLVLAVDPTLSVEVLTGTALAEHVLAEIDAHDTRELRDLLDANYRPPGTWELTPAVDTVTGDAGDTVTTTLRFDGHTAGTGYYAVSYADDELGETTDGWLIEVDEEGNVFVVADPSGMELRAIA